MKKLMLVVFVLFLICSASSAFAYRRGSSPSTSGGYTQDAYGHWTSNDNLYNDTDADGRVNMYDRSDNNPYK